MWLIFLLSALAFGIVALLICYIGNKVLNKIRQENYIADKRLEAINEALEKMNKKEN